MPSRTWKAPPPSAEVAKVRSWVRAVTRPKQILDGALATLGYDKHNPKFFRENFEDALSNLMDEGLRVLHKEQTALIRKIVVHSDSFSKIDVDTSDEILWEGMKSLSNQRMKRAGVAMEGIMGFILGRCDIEYQRGQPRTGRSDFICPNIKAFDTYPEYAVILEFKRTLRERWKEVLDELAKSHTVWLVTLDRGLTRGTVESIGDSNITLYVRQSVYEVLPRDHKHLRSIRTLLEDIRGRTGSNPQTRFA
jgi:hypothetical protein